MTQKDYIKFAKIFKEAYKNVTPVDNPETVIRGLEDDITNLFDQDNPKFDRFKWCAFLEKP